MNNKAAVFILLGQSNAVGHGIPMKDSDKITEPLKNVFGLSRQLNQTFENDSLYWSGYTSVGMNLAEEQDDTYSVANCLARLWQAEIDSGNSAGLPDLYIIHIAIGAQGVTNGYMWNPGYEKKLIPGVLNTVDISLYPFTTHILSLLGKSMNELGKTEVFTTIHWRGGEEDAQVSKKDLEQTLKETYAAIFNGLYQSIGEKAETVLHKLAAPDRYLDIDPSGDALKSMHYINEVFESLSCENENITMFDVTKYPQFVPGVRGNGIFKEDVVHFTPEVNEWVAKEILNQYKNN